MDRQQPARCQLWVGIDTGKGGHHAAAVAGDGQLVWSRRVANEQAAITELIGLATASAAGVCWAVDLTCSSAALLLALLVEADQPVVYVPGRVVNRMAGAFAGRPRPTPRTRWSSPRQPGCGGTCWRPDPDTSWSPSWPCWSATAAT